MDYNPSLNSPANNATGVAIYPQFSWSQSEITPPQGSNFELRLSTNASDVTNPSLSPTYYTQDTGTFSWQYTGTPLQSNTVYYWTVATYYGSGTDFSETRSFTTIAASSPDVPTLSSPSDHAIDTSINPSMSWGAVSNADSYGFQLSTNPGFSSTIIDTSTTNTFVDASNLQYSTVYYWRVNATNISGTSDYATRDFTTGARPIPLCNTITLTSPPNGGLIEKITTMEWQADENAATYDLNVSTNSGFASSITLSVFDKVAAIELDNDKQYYWRVRGVNVTGNGPWSNSRMFYTVPATSPSDTASATVNFNIPKTTEPDIVVGDSTTTRHTKANTRFDYIDFDMASWKLTLVTDTYEVSPKDEFLLVSVSASKVITFPKSKDIVKGRRFVVGNSSTVTITLDAVDSNINAGATISVAPGRMRRIFKAAETYLAY